MQLVTALVDLAELRHKGAGFKSMPLEILRQLTIEQTHRRLLRYKRTYLLRDKKNAFGLFHRRGYIFSHCKITKKF